MPHNHTTQTTLAPYAQHHQHTRGRQHPQPHHPQDHRTPYQHDRDRIIHSRAFRRLEHKTQVFLNPTGDHYRTRLTHTIEVAAIARNIATALHLNQDLTEAIALAHDLGHPPLGHIGETTLNQLMQNHNGFEHNQQSLRIIQHLEQKYPNHPGLNPTWELLEGLAKHHTPYDTPKPPPPYNQTPNPSLEAQIANLADEIAYTSHDLDDGLDANLLNETHLKQNTQTWQQAAAQTNLPHNTPTEPRRHTIIRHIIHNAVQNVIQTTQHNLQKHQPKTTDHIRNNPQRLANYSTQLQQQNSQLRQYLQQNLYHHPKIQQPNQSAAQTLKKLFQHYIQNPHTIGTQSQKHIPKHGLHRATCDYIAGMTDPYLHTQARRHNLIP